MEVGAHVWVYFDSFWQLGCIHDISKESVECILTDTNQSVQVDSSALRICNDIATRTHGADDLTTLVHLHEPAILNALAVRFEQNKVYTRTGAILVAMNPCQSLPLYTSDIQASYMAQGSLNNKGSEANTLAPHVYEIADRAYREMISSGDAHNILVSGESGAGKTETTKILLTYVAALSTSETLDSVRQRVLECNPVLESFGNAKTTRNNNSSRFGKFIRLNFTTNGLLVGASISTYLLERVRIVSQMAGERNYHIFYELMQGATPDIRSKLHLHQSMDSFHYLNQSGCYTRHDNIDDSAQFQRTRHALSTVGLTDEDQEWVFQLVAAVLHLGNIKFSKKSQDGSRISDGSSVTASLVCDLLGILDTEFEKALCTREIIAGFEPVTIVVSVERAANARDTFAKAIYSRLFDYLVQRINTSLAVDAFDSTMHQLGIVDIFGFEIFATNSLEQLCINFANEKLQQLFVRFVFEMEQLEYTAEELPWTLIEYPRNDACVSLFESRPFGLFTLLDEQARLSKGSDRTLATKYYEAFHEHSHFSASPLEQAHGAFTVRHFAGAVQYKTKGFCTKNKDPVPHEALSALTTSSHDFICDLFDDWHPHDMPHNAQLTPKAATSHSFTGRNPSPPSSGRSSLVGRPSLRSSLSSATVLSSTVCLTFKMQLSSLLATLETSIPHFIRCIKPNDAMTPRTFDASRVLDQLQCCGLVEITRIARAGYPVRMPHERFLQTFRSLDPEATTSTTAAALVSQLPTTAPLLVGITKVFLTQAAYDTLLSAVASRRLAAVIVLQSYVRLYHGRSTFLRLRASAVEIQTFIRGVLTKRHYHNQRNSALTIQRAWRFWVFQQNRQSAAVVVQRAWRSTARRWIAKWNRACLEDEAAIRIQQLFRQSRAMWQSHREEEPETELHSDSNCTDAACTDDEDDEGMADPLVKSSTENYTLQWLDGVLGLSFDISFSTPVVRRVHTQLSECAEIERVRKGDRLLAIGINNIRSQDNLRELLEAIVPPVNLTFAPWSGSFPSFATEMITIGMARSSCRPRQSSIVQPNEFEVLADAATFRWSPFKTSSAMMPMVYSFDGDMHGNPGLTQLQPSDILLQIGSVCTSDLSYEEAIKHLDEVKRPIVLRFQVGSREPSSWANHIVVCWNEGSLGVDWSWDNIFNQGLEIQRMHAHGLVAQQKGLQVGDILLQINHQDTALLGPDIAQKLLMQHHPSALQLTFQQTPSWKRHFKALIHLVAHGFSFLASFWVQHDEIAIRILLGIALYCVIFFLDEILFFPLRFL